MDDLSFDLHVLTAQLDQAADRILRAQLGVPYRRFLALFMVEELGATTQRALAVRLGVTEPSVSRMTTVLAQAGYLQGAATPVSGNRRSLELTDRGRELVRHCRELLAGRLAVLLDASGVPADQFSGQVRALLATLTANVAKPAQISPGPVAVEAAGPVSA